MMGLGRPPVIEPAQAPPSPAAIWVRACHPAWPRGLAARADGAVVLSRLNKPVDEAKSQARYSNSVLELTLPKKTEAGTKRLAIE